MPYHGLGPIPSPPPPMSSLLTEPPLRPTHEPFRVERILNPTGPAAKRRHRVIAVLPAYNAEKTLAATLADFPPGCVDDILLVDDGSKDSTVAVAREMGLSVIVHPQNRGYGGNQKTCYKYALENGADVSRQEALKCGMPWWKYFSNRFLTFLENVALGQNLGDFHSGFRVYRRSVLETIPFERNSDDFVFDTQFLAQAVHFGFRLGDLPVPVRYFAEASSINFKRSTVYGIRTLWTMARFWLHRTWLWRSRLFKKS
jgi:glycosyltransferase involved in cell wall biosynthesis